MIERRSQLKVSCTVLSHLPKVAGQQHTKLDLHISLLYVMSVRLPHEHAQQGCVVYESVVDSLFQDDLNKDVAPTSFILVACLQKSMLSIVSLPTTTNHMSTHLSISLSVAVSLSLLRLRPGQLIGIGPMHKYASYEHSRPSGWQSHCSAAPAVA